MKICPNCTAGYHDSHSTCPTHGGVLSEIRELRPGMIVRQSYQIVRKLGQGGFGTVYLADHLLMEEQRALKFLSPDWAADAGVTSRFRREVKTLRQVRHRNVVDCGDLEQAEDDSLFFSMEFVDGADLWDFMKAAPKPFDVELALSITRGIAEGLGAAHALGMVHRDIKPENILMARVGDTWVPKIADFGIVATKESSDQRTRTKTGGSLLTMAYAAPEQWRGTPSEQLDGRTDLYALGGVLFEMLTGETVFDAKSYEGWAEQHKNVVPRPPSELRRELKDWCGLDELMLRLLSKDPHSRPENVTALLRLLDGFRHVVPEVRRETVQEQPVTTRHDNTIKDEFGPGSTQQGVADEPAYTVGVQRDARGIQPQQPKRDRKPSGRLARVLGIATVALGAIAFILFWLSRMHPSEPKPSPENASLNLPAGNPQAGPAKNQDVTLKPSAGSGNPHDAKPKPAANPQLPHEEPAVTPPAQPKPIEPAKPATPSSSPAELYAAAHELEIQKHYAESAPLFERACEGGHADSCNALGYLYQNGAGVSRDYLKAVTLYSKACNANAATGCYNLGYMYESGYGVSRDYSQATQFYGKACNGNKLESCNHLGYMYQNQIGVSKDYSRALSLYMQACDAGSGAGCSNVGYLYWKGLGISPDSAKAKKMFSEGCTMGYANACTLLRQAIVAQDSPD